MNSQSQPITNQRRLSKKNSKKENKKFPYKHSRVEKLEGGKR